MIRRFVEPLPRPSMLAPESFWARSDLNPVPISFLAGALVVVVGLIIGACDRLGGSSVGPAEAPRAPMGFLPDSTVWLVDMDAEDQLLSPGTPQRIDRGSGSRAAGDSLQEAALAGRLAGEVASPYGCVMSTPNVNGAPSEGAYRYETVYALFPQEVVAAAGGETRRVRFQMNSRVAYTTGRRAEAQVLRQARCRIPDTDRAQRLVRERLERFPAPDEKAGGKEIAGPPWSGQSTSSLCFTSSGLSGAQAKGAECVEWTLELACVETCDPSPTGMESDGCVTTCEVVGKKCVRYSFDQNPDSGGGGDDTGDDSNPCGSEGATDELCGPGTGGSTDPADDINETERCDGDPLKDMDIRATGCGENASIEGGRYGDTRGPNNNQFHPGIDVLNDVGDPVYAAEGGTVFRVATQRNNEGEDVGWGHYVIIQTGTLESGDIEYHVYTHLQDEGRVSAKPESGDGFVTIEAGDEIGQTGTSGNSDDDCSGGPPHLHYEVRQGDRWTASNEPETVNPENHLGTEFSDSTGTAISDSCSSN